MGCVKKNEISDARWLTVILAVIIIIWRVPFLNKGIDYTDTGYSLVNYYEVFNGDGINSIGVFITTLLGGLFYNSMISGQLLILRILHWMIGLFSICLSYQIFRKYITKNTLMLVLLVLSLKSKNGEMLFNYYVLTTFLLLLSIFLLHKGLVYNKWWLILSSGIISGINVFVRLPNVFFGIISLGILIYGKSKEFLMRKTFHYILLFMFGVLIGVSIDLILMMLYMTPSQMFQSFMNYANLAFGSTSVSFHNFLNVEETNDAHSIIVLMRLVAIQVIRTLLLVMTYAIPALVIWIISYKTIVEKTKNSNILKYYLTAGVVCLYCLSFIFVFSRFVERNINLFLYLYSLSICIYGLVKYWKRKAEYAFLYALALLLAPSTVLGSDLGLYRLGVMQLFLVPLTFVPLFDGHEIRGMHSEKASLVKSHMFIIHKIILCLIFGGILISHLLNIQVTYMDASYNQLTECVRDNTGLLNGMCTSINRAHQLEEYQKVMSREELKGKQVAIFGYFPLGLVLGCQKNYFTSPCVDYPSCKVKSLLFQIDRHLKNGDAPPIIVLSYINQLQRHDDHYTSPAKIAVIHYMLSLTDYRIIHQSENFTIYVPCKKS